MDIPEGQEGVFRPRVCEERNLLDSHSVTRDTLVERVFLFILWSMVYVQHMYTTGTWRTRTGIQSFQTTRATQSQAPPRNLE